VRLLAGQDNAILDWLARKYQAHARFPCVTLGTIDDAGVLRGAFVITMSTETTAELHVYGRISNDTVRDMFHAVFGYLGVYRLEVRVSKRNKITKRAAPKFGFRFEGSARDFYGPGEDALLFSMRPHECRWLREPDGIAIQKS
jgi:hypothetical protein